MAKTPCPFCTIVAGNDPRVREVYRDDDVVAFFPTEPAVIGHYVERQTIGKSSCYSFRCT